MRSTFRNPTIALVLLIVLYVVSTDGKSIIRGLLENQAQFAPDSPARSVTRLGRQHHFQEAPLEQCRVHKDKELFGKLERLCDECYQTYRANNFHTQCRSKCFNNEVFRGCALALFRESVMASFEEFLGRIDVKTKGEMLTPDEISDSRAASAMAAMN